MSNLIKNATKMKQVIHKIWSNHTIPILQHLPQVHQSVMDGSPIQIPFQYTKPTPIYSKRLPKVP